MSRLIRCIEGHVYDRDVHDACPECGAVPSDTTMAASPAEDAAGVEQTLSQGSEAPARYTLTFDLRMLAALVASLVVVAGLALWALSRDRPESGDAGGDGERELLATQQQAPEAGTTPPPRANTDQDAAARPDTAEDRQAAEPGGSPATGEETQDDGVTARPTDAEPHTAQAEQPPIGGTPAIADQRAPGGDDTAPLAETDPEQAQEPPQATDIAPAVVDRRPETDDAATRPAEAKPEAVQAKQSTSGDALPLNEQPTEDADDTTQIVKAEVEQPELPPQVSDGGPAVTDDRPEAGDIATNPGETDFDAAQEQRPAKTGTPAIAIEEATGGDAEAGPPRTEPGAEEEERIARAGGPPVAGEVPSAGGPAAQLEQAAPPADLVLGAEALPVDPNDPDGHYDRARAYHDRGELDRAIADYDRAIALDPEYLDAFTDRGRAYHQKGELDRAIADYSEAIMLDPQDAIARFNRGLAHYDQGDLDLAIADLDQAIALNAQDADAHVWRGTAYFDKGEIRQAINDYTLAIGIDPQNAEALNGRAWTYFTSGEADKGLADIDKALELAPDSANYYDTRGHIHEALGFTAEAIADFRRALELDPTDDQRRGPLERLGVDPSAVAPPADAVAQSTLDEECRTAIPDQVIRACTALIESGAVEGKRLGFANYRLGVAHLDNGDVDRAIADFDRAIALGYETATVWFRRGDANSLNGARDAAIEDYGKAVERDRNFEPPYTKRGLLYIELGRYGDAVMDFAESLRLKPDRPQSEFNRAEAYRLSGQYEYAIAGYSNAIQADPGYADAYQNRGVAFYIKGRFDDAIADWTRVIELEPDYTNAFFNRGLAHLQLGALDLAQSDLQSYFELASPNLDPSQKAFDYNLICWDLALTAEAEQALPYCDQSLELDPNSAGTWDSLAFVQWQLDRPDDAQASLARARDLDADLLDYDRRLDEYLILLIHQGLLHLGYEPGVVDQNNDDRDGRLSASIRSFQAEVGLDQTGEPSFEVYRALKERLATLGPPVGPALNPEIETPGGAPDRVARTTHAEPLIVRKDPRFTVIADSTGMVIDGKLENELVDEVRNILEREPGLRTIHIDSSGGTLRAGFDLFDLFSERGVRTYSFNRCSGPCAHAFLGGDARIVHPDVRFTFVPITYSVNSEAQRQAILNRFRREQAQRFATRELPPAIVAAIESVDADGESLELSAEELRSSGFATAIDPEYPVDLHRIVVNLPIDGDDEDSLYSVEVDGPTLRISGRLGWGLDRRVSELFSRHDDIRTVELDSLGGRTPVGLRLFDLFLEKGVDTYVRRECGSACTTAFLAGRRRIIDPGAKLGFHRTGTTSDTEEKLLRIFFDINRQRYASRNIASWFADRVAETPNSEAWVPSQDELLSAGFVTEIAR